MMYNMKFKHPAMVPGLVNMMDRFLGDDFQLNYKGNQPAVNIVEKEKEFTLEVIAPGLNKADFNVSVDKNLLTISYAKKEENEESKPNYIRKEYSYKSFSRTFTLTEELNSDGIEASYENGVLHVSIPKSEERQKEVKAVEVK